LTDYYFKPYSIVLQSIPENVLLYYCTKIRQTKETAVLQDLLLESDADYIRSCCFIKPVFKVTTEDLEEITRIVCTEFMVMRSINELTQFEEGLDVLGFKNLVKTYPLQFKELFIHNPKVVTGHDLDELFLPLLSSEGNNLRQAPSLL